MAGLEKHKSNVNSLKYKYLVSFSFFLENISFLFLRRSGGRRYRAGRRPRGRSEPEPARGLVQGVSLPSVCLQPAQEVVGSDQERSPRVICWVQGLANWRQGARVFVQQQANKQTKRWKWTNGPIRASSRKHDLDSVFSHGPFHQWLPVFPPPPPCRPVAAARQRAYP